MLSMRQRLFDGLHRRPGWATACLLAPALLWLVALALVPMGVLAYYSVLSRGPWGTIVHTLTLEHYQHILDPVFLRVLGRTCRLALLTTVLCLLGGYILAYWMAFYGGHRKFLYSFLIMLPFWTSDLVRLYAWMTLLADHGVINNALLALGVLQEPLPLLYNEGAVVLGLVYTYLPFMVLPLYAALERLDRRVLEAAADLGATPLECLWKVTLPLTRGGMLSGSVLVFVPSLGEFLVPELLGGAKTMLLGKFIALKFTGLRNWPLGAAYALVLVVMIVLLLGLYVRLVGRKQAFEAPVS
ncbi:MAG: ABC transporter permease [Candidatus Tectomicrobia bacterium]|uniref:ABC transporter permease n=1 Tax=Tectimicrobiota bacterium TaxID=2528274 RepID=A0A938B1U8_UNCTE|nr:ABC transporter permease [Candidatus Tectomicrobia bacterium]